MQVDDLVLADEGIVTAITAITPAEGMATT